MSAEDKLRDDFNAIRKALEYIKGDDYKYVVPLMSENQRKLIDSLLREKNVKDVRALVYDFKSKQVEYMPIMELRSKAQSLGIKNFKTLPPETLRKMVHETLNQTVQQTSESDSQRCEDEARD